MSGVVFVPAQRLSGVVLTLPVVSLQSRFAALCPHGAEVDFTNEL